MVNPALRITPSTCGVPERTWAERTELSQTWNRTRLNPIHSRCSWLGLDQTLSQKYCINNILKDNPKITFETSCPAQYKSFEETNTVRFRNSSRVKMTNILFVLIHNVSTKCHLFWSQIPIKKAKGWIIIAWIIINYKCRVTTKDFRDQKKPVPDTMNLSSWSCAN